MTMFDTIFATLIPKDAESANDSAASESGSLMQKEHRIKVEKIVKKSTEAEKAAAFQQAFNQNNIEMMEMLTGVGGYKPSPEMKNDKGVPLKQWLNDQARGTDDATRNLLTAVERKLDTPALALSARSLAQVSAIQMDANMWGMGGISSNNLVLPPAPQRGSVLGMVA